MSRAMWAFVVALVMVISLSPASVVAAGSHRAVFLGESAFLFLHPGETGALTVFWGNVGVTTWTGDAVVLAVCGQDAVTCDESDATTAAFASGWLGPTRYARAAQESVAPGKVGTFTYNVGVPPDAAEGTYRFYGTLWDVLGNAPIDNVGYYQEVTVAPAGAASLAWLTPESGSDAGAEIVTVTGSGFECTPFPTVMFDADPASVLECGENSLRVVTPGHAAATVSVTVTNAQGSASNAVEFTFVDDTPPTFDSVTVVGQNVWLYFSEPVCVPGGTLSPDTGDASVRVNAVDVVAAGGVTNDEILFSDCDLAASSVTATMQIDPAEVGVVGGDVVSITLTAAGVALVQDAAFNVMTLSQTRSTIAAGDAIRPSMSSAEIVGSTQVRVTWSEEMKCSIGAQPAFTFKSSAGWSRTNTGTDCAGTYGDDTVVATFAAGTFTATTSGTLVYDPLGATPSTEVVDTTGNGAARQSIATASYSPATVTWASIETNVGFGNVADSGDVVRLEFSKDMQDAAGLSSAQLWLEDSDGTAVIVRCDPTADSSDGYIGAACVRDPDGTGELNVFSLTVKEPTDVSTDDEAAGSTSGLGWPATIGDILGWIPEYSDLTPTDIAGSPDQSID